MKLIVDCGSTKAEWLVLDGMNEIERAVTTGFNPNFTDKNTISSITLNNDIYNIYNENITEVVFYGTGCASERNSSLIRNIFTEHFKHSKVNVFCDMTAACHALLGDEKGVAGILGTGSNSCFYEDGVIKERAVSLGFILGDEGSGAHIGKTLLRDYFYGVMPKELREMFENEYKLTREELIDNVYHSQHPSKYIASYLPFAYNNLDNEYVKDLCLRCFDDYVTYFILRFKDRNADNTGIVGSVGYYFKDIVNQCFEKHGLPLPSIIKSPMENLIRYHALR